MSVIHFLNVLEGDCNIIQHDTGRISVIDVSNADDNIDTFAEGAKKASPGRASMFNMSVPAGKINYGQKKIPENPISYIRNNLKANEIFRFIITHPDMDHLDGIADFFRCFSILNVWDTNNNKEIADFRGGGYNKEDWDFYKSIRNGNTGNRRVFYSYNSVDFFNEDKIQILAPTESLVAEANKCGDYNDCSYVLLYTPPKHDGKAWKILFAGDSHDKTWDFILKHHTELVSNIDVLIAPHHGRDSSRNYDFLKVIKPHVTLFGNASSAHLAYSCYPETRITNNQAGTIILDINPNAIDIYVKNQAFANDFRNSPKRRWGNTTYNWNFQAYGLARLTS